MKWVLSVVFAVLIFMEANAYDGRFDDGLDSSWSYIDYSNQDETNPISTSLYISEEYYSHGSQPKSIYVYDSEIPYEGGYSTPYQLWIATNGEITQYMQCPLYTQLRLIAYSPGGSGTISEIYPDGRQIRNFYQFEIGNTELTFVADEPGRHMLGYQIYGQRSNFVIIDVVSSGGLAGPSCPAGSNHPPEVHSLEANLQKSGYPGAAITFTADASDQDGDQILHKFWIAKMPPKICQIEDLDFNDYRPVTEWTTTDKWTWYPQESDFGVYAIMVDVRDGLHQPPESWDDFAETIKSICHQDPSSVDFNIENCPPCYNISSTGKAPRKTTRPKGGTKKSG